MGPKEGVVKMKILLIEDEDRGVRQAMASIDHVFRSPTVRVARSLTEARLAIADEAFDLAICDIRIVSDEISLDANESHGLAAYEELHANAPGTPTVFLSAFAKIENTSGRASAGGVADVLGIRSFPLTQVVPKGDPANIERYLIQIREGMERLENCRVTGARTLDEMFTRVVQMYAQFIQSTQAQVTPMGGLSGANVGLVRYTQDTHADVAVVIKLDKHDRIRVEVERYSQYVAPRLAVGSFAPQIQTFAAGLRGMTAVISSVASPSSGSLFARLAAVENVVDIARVRSTTSPWSSVSEPTRTTIGEYRKTVISDDLFRAIPSFSEALTALDDVEVELAWKLGHGDMHGENVLIDDAGNAVLIDFADCAVLPAALDAAALELSLLAHPKSPIDEVWPEVECENWCDLDVYLSASPWATEIRQIREWALAEAGEMQALVVYFAQACWLMKHGGTGETRMNLVALSALIQIRAIIDQQASGDANLT
jgi:hypothetical protein